MARTQYYIVETRMIQFVVLFFVFLIVLVSNEYSCSPVVRSRRTDSATVSL